MPTLRNKKTGQIIVIPDGGGIAPNPIKVQGAQADVANTQARTVGQEIANRRSQATLPADITLKTAQAEKARAEAQKATGLDKQKLANIRTVQRQIDRLSDLYKKGPGKTKGFAGVLDYLPTNANAAFDTAGAGLGEVGLAAFRVPGIGSQSDAELRAFIDANRPSASDRDSAILEKLNNLQTRLDQTYSAYGIQRQSGGDDGWKVERVND